jgi:acyl carrier protein
MRHNGAIMPPSTPKATEPEIQAWCAAYLRTALKLPNLPDVGAEFPSLGLDSAESVFLVSAIEDWLGLELASDTALEYPSIAQLARFVAGRLAAKDAAQAGRGRAT